MPIQLHQNSLLLFHRVTRVTTGMLYCSVYSKSFGKNTTKAASIHTESTGAKTWQNIAEERQPTQEVSRFSGITDRQ